MCNSNSNACSSSAYRSSCNSSSQLLPADLIWRDNGDLEFYTVWGLETLAIHRKFFFSRHFESLNL